MQVLLSPNNTNTQLALQIPQQALCTANFPPALLLPAMLHGYDIVHNCKGSQCSGSGAYTCHACVITMHHDAATGFANCNPDAQWACQPCWRLSFQFLCHCCACIVHNPCWMCGMNSFIGPTQLAVFNFTCASHFRTCPAWTWHAQLMPITAT